MRNDKYDIKNFVSVQEKDKDKRFWIRAFLVYAGVEVLILGTQYIITRSQCAYCVMPPLFYVVNWLQHLLFTALLWFFLGKFYRIRWWKAVVLNIFLFLVHYFLWLALLQIIVNSKITGLVPENIPYRDFRHFIYGSWLDIGKYVLKLSAFYAIKFYFEYRKAETQRIQLAVINKDMQLNLLKQQLSPHFYFNTLNNLYGLARSNSPKLPGALHQLSNIMRYVIVDCNQPKVLLSQEIKFLESYIALEKLRYEQNTLIEMEVRGEPGQSTILPLLLIQFVENAFKHGMKEKSDRNWMKVHLDVSGNQLLFEVDNSYYEASHSQGIGINSVKHILNLQYEGKYDIRIQHEENRFLVTLKLNLS